MARNGSGTFIRLYSWEQDAANNIRIRADRMDNEMDGMADALTGSIASDGQTPITANLPMSGFKHTDVADATQRNQYATWGQTQDNTAQWGGTDTGAADAYEITTTPVTTSYVAGQVYRFKVGSGNTNTGGAATLSVNGLPTRNLKDQDGNDPAAGEIRAAGFYEATYDGTNFIFSGYLSGTAYGVSLIASADAAAALSTLNLSDSDTPNFDGVQLENNEIGDLTGAGTIFWDASHGMYQVDNTNTAHLMWSSQAVTAGDGISITYNATTDQPTVALDGTLSGNDILTEADVGTGGNQIPTNNDIDVAGKIADFSLGQVGTYAFLSRGGGNASIDPGSTYSGSALRYFGVLAQIEDGTNVEWSGTLGGTPSGTWRAMGRTGSATNHYSATLLLRIS